MLSMKTANRTKLNTFFFYYHLAQHCEKWRPSTSITTCFLQWIWDGRKSHEEKHEEFPGFLLQAPMKTKLRTPGLLVRTPMSYFTRSVLRLASTWRVSLLEGAEDRTSSTHFYYYGCANGTTSHGAHASPCQTGVPSRPRAGETSPTFAVSVTRRTNSKSLIFTSAPVGRHLQIPKSLADVKIEIYTLQKMERITITDYGGIK